LQDLPRMLEKGSFFEYRGKKIEKRWFSLSSLKKLIKELVRVDDSPKRIARGLAIGVFWGILPTFGLAILFALPTAIFLRANKFSTILGLFVANPFTTPFIYAFEYKIGELILRVTPVAVSWRLLQLENLLKLAKSLLVGGSVLAIGIALLTYFLALQIIIRYRVREPKKGKERRQAGKFKVLMARIKKKVEEITNKLLG